MGREYPRIRKKIDLYESFSDKIFEENSLEFSLKLLYNSLSILKNSLEEKVYKELLKD